MQLQLKNLNKVRLVAWLLYAIFELILQVLFQIWFLYPSVYWAVNNILARFDFVQSGINFKYITTPSLFKVSKKITYKKKQNISQIRNQKYENILSHFRYEKLLSHIVWDDKLKFTSGLKIFEIFEIYWFEIRENCW